MPSARSPSFEVGLQEPPLGISAECLDLHRFKRPSRSKGSSEFGLNRFLGLMISTGLEDLGRGVLFYGHRILGFLLGLLGLPRDLKNSGLLLTWSLCSAELDSKVCVPQPQYQSKRH
ncbi:hypothetical protein L1987_24929 [Smallanthus sonchifolius]|uniref:Uncharacterized protein n=1 Tax=Smallanthus sonchifolius TaxID=185202 RepID=A0ACB9INA3_9ASTR|nr:hypothetical protein L1987_24929 [Smallanthus sonchifolius]